MNKIKLWALASAAIIALDAPPALASEAPDEAAPEAAPEAESNSDAPEGGSPRSS